jgi:magnesium chelatase family protein
MELSVIHSRALAGIEAPHVQVETHLSNGLPAFHIVGLPETAVREARDRVRSAILNAHFAFPDRRITVNLAPADLPKEGGRFDLPIALGILTASGQLPGERLAEHEFVGELALDSALRPVPGVIPAATAATGAGRCLAVGSGCASLAAQVPGSRVIGATDLLSLCAHLNGSVPISPAHPDDATPGEPYPDLADVTGQDGARRALEVAAAGGHNLLMRGPPGTGKTLLASRLPGILPAPTADEVLTGLALRNYLDPAVTNAGYRRPFRTPHHSTTAGALVGGGSRPRPGEISLAHGGVLFLDELPEFSRDSLEALREPLETGEITVSRSRHKVTYPARFQLVAAMNPCPCGFDGDPERHCRCSPQQIHRYRHRISGPLLDRIDLQVAVNRIPAGLLLDPQPGEPSDDVRARVECCRERQLQRQGCANAQLPPDTLSAVCRLGSGEKAFLERAAGQLQLSGRGLHRILRVARTLADLAGEDRVGRGHLSEALAYRNSDLQ